MRGASSTADPAFPISSGPADLPSRVLAFISDAAAHLSAFLSSLMGSAALSDGLRSQAHTASGALFAAGWWVFGDAVLTLPHAPGTPVPTPPFMRWAPGLLATLAAVLMASVGAASGGEAFSEGVQSTGGSVALFGAFCAAFAAVVGGAGTVIALHGAWLGVATVLQCVLLLGSGLAAFVASSEEGGGGGWGSYAAF